MPTARFLVGRWGLALCRIGARQTEAEAAHDEAAPPREGSMAWELRPTQGHSVARGRTTCASSSGARSLPRLDDANPIPAATTTGR